MRNIIAIAKKEMTVYLTTPWAWIVFTFVSFVSSFFFIGLLVQFNGKEEQSRKRGAGSSAEPAGVDPESSLRRGPDRRGG